MSMEKTAGKIQDTINAIEKQFGKGSVMHLGEDFALHGIAVTRTGSIGLDIALGVGGLPKGRIVEVFGPESSGKTTLALHAIAQAHKNGGFAGFVDAEHSLDMSYAARIGVDSEKLIISQPDHGEQALEIAEMMVRGGGVEIVVIDSVAALTPRAEIEGEMGEPHMGLQARLMSQALRKLTGTISKSGTTVIFINQLRMKIGVMFGNPETTPGGNALKFYSSVRLDVRRIGAIKKNEETLGNRTRVKVVKNKVARPHKETEFDIEYGEGISRLGELIDIGSDLGIVTKSGAWYAVRDEKIGQGRENAKAYLRDNPTVADEIEKAIYEKSSIGPG